ncbi:hypothetical protein N7492_003303 [Penicillium capsulatum]|uniref:Uncharacterized protein n=1 Tax=Penicillium capsulatum TaxID=69766 RepID=A0A9W9IL22_9EURO|nr:hypothetical protein N7492_003303 [Penicillium capsulatum]KAJ6122113.1 hypothetical protein N7512_004578 [Penicillium capsulatum]
MIHCNTKAYPNPHDILQAGHVTAISGEPVFTKKFPSSLPIAAAAFTTHPELLLITSGWI